jgi:CubicO group peptidase (beta-lactamase class C family)
MQDRLFGPLGMKDTTFWPSEEQVKRLAKSYRANKDKNGLDEQPISQLQLPLWDRSKRFPMPAGGLFSTAGDTAKFCRMILNGGTFNGKRLLSEDAVKQMTSKQTGPKVNDGYGLGLSVGPDGCGHGGAHATNMQIDRKRGLILIWMVQHTSLPANGNQCQGVFTQAATEKVAPVATGR